MLENIPYNGDGTNNGDFDTVVRIIMGRLLMPEIDALIFDENFLRIVNTKDLESIRIPETSQRIFATEPGR